MDKLKQDLFNLNNKISDLETQIEEEKINAEINIQPLKIQLNQIKQDKTKFASKNDFESVQACRRKEENLKFKINAQWNKYSILKDKLTRLNNEKQNLQYQIKLKEDEIKRTHDILSQMNTVLDNYKKTQSLKQAAIDSKISLEHVEQWYGWGKKGFNETSTYFYTKITEIDNYFKEQESLKLKEQMDRVIEAYKKTNSLEEASRIANVSFDTVQYWYDWGSKGFGEENTYFYRKLQD